MPIFFIITNPPYLNLDLKSNVSFSLIQILNPIKLTGTLFPQSIVFECIVQARKALLIIINS